MHNTFADEVFWTHEQAGQLLLGIVWAGLLLLMVSIAIITWILYMYRRFIAHKQSPLLLKFNASISLIIIFMYIGILIYSNN
jgi:hypothetical protein